LNQLASWHHGADLLVCEFDTVCKNARWLWVFIAAMGKTKQGVMKNATTIEKIMALSPREFEKSIAAFAGAHVPVVDGRASIALGTEGQIAEIVFEPLPPRRVGGLLDLPQARVSIVMPNVASELQSDFLRRFDIAFQRGGG